MIGRRKAVVFPPNVDDHEWLGDPRLNVRMIDVSLVRYSSFPSVAFSAEDRANRFMLVLMALQRVSYLVPALAGFSSPVYRSASVNLALLVVTLAWNLLLFWRAARLGWFQPGLVL
ncbi:MAG TPA: hypothetical protein VGD43_12990, partial [Micromonospora sp.]